MTAKNIRGVALVVQNLQGQILVLQEYETKPHFGKRCGMFSIPMETVEPGESDPCAMVRLVADELPGLELGNEQILGSRIGIYRVVPRVWVNLYSTRTENGQLPNSGGHEVGNHQWMAPEIALHLWLRQGAWEMIRDFMSKKRNALCRRCRIPDRAFEPR